LTLHQTRLRDDVQVLVLWTLYLPALACWPFTSAFPVFALLDNSGSAAAIAVELLFLATGFWALLSGASLYWLVKSDAASNHQSEVRKSRGLQIGLYATLWTLTYMARGLAA
jgi:hypothetical protein